ncbi:MAG TPA: hypothetical protein VNK41_05265 [Vicinamibacterales bacterium]|nr:hypothetical protein [Vicinamibacterales bacterium]
MIPGSQASPAAGRTFLEQDGDRPDAAAPAPTRRRGGLVRLLDACDDAWSRYVLRVLDAALTAELPADDRSGAVPGGSRRYSRTQRAVRLLHWCFPLASEAARKRLLRTGRLPFRGGDIRLLSYGSSATVFLLLRGTDACGSDGIVLKIYRRSLGRRTTAVIEHARARLALFERARRWYEGEDILLPTAHLVLHAPLLARPAAASVQPFLPGRHVDVFDGVSEDELVALLCAHPALAAQFRFFADRTLRAADAEGACVDIVGPNNLVVAGGESPRLWLIDVGIYEFERKRQRSPRALAKMTRRLAYLRRVANRLQQKTAVAAQP